MNSRQKAISLSNGQFELVVAPEIGRIVRYGAVGGQNVLWENPRAREAASPFEGWLNWGGDKVWIWPEDDWSKWQNGLVAPPGDPPTATYEVEQDRLALRMTSPVLPSYGVRIVREISLAPAGPDVKLVNRIEKVVETSSTEAIPVAVWVVTQVPAPKRIFARLVRNAPSPGYEGFAKSPWPDIEVAGNIAILTRPAEPWMKIGLDADILATQVGDLLFVVRVPEADNATEGYEPFRRAQVFSDPDRSDFRPAGVPPYIEFEFTSPLRRLAVGESVSLTVTWSLHDPRKDVTRPRIHDVTQRRMFADRAAGRMLVSRLRHEGRSPDC